MQLFCRHYKQAFNNLLEIQITDTNAMEIKVVASFINYKICKIMFNLNAPKEAVSHFRQHTDRSALISKIKDV